MVWCSLQDFTEAIAQLAMYPPGREALLQDPTVAEALHQVASEGWEQEARQFAEAALAALSDIQPDADHEQDPDQRHVMMQVHKQPPTACLWLQELCLTDCLCSCRSYQWVSTQLIPNAA